MSFAPFADAESLAREWRCDYRRLIRLNCYALIRVFIPHDDNNDLRTALAFGLFVVWALLTLGAGFGDVHLDTIRYGVMTAVVYAIIGRLWHFEVTVLDSVVTTDDDDAGD